MSLLQDIETKLRDKLAPALLEVHNESGMHNVPKGSETHFKVVIVSTVFEGKPSLARHRLVYEVLAEEMKPGRVHALAITSRTPAEWDASPEGNVSPLCKGGSQS